MPKTTCRVKAWIENTALLCAIALVVAILSTPLVVFLVFRDSDLDNWQDTFSTLSQALDTCGSQSDNNSSNTTLSLGCTALPETSPCYPHIAALIEGQGTTDKASLMVSSRGDMSELQASLELLLSDPFNFLTSRCRSTGLPLYCNFLFPPCYNGRVDPTLQLTHSQCNTLVEDICQEEFSTLMLSFFDYIRETVPHLIPNCDTLPKDNNETVLGQDAGSADNANYFIGNSTNATSAVVCDPGFINTCGLCIPSCGRIHLNSPLATSYAVDEAIWVILEVFGTVGALVFLVLSLIRRKEVFQFPTILVFQENLAELLLGVVLLLAQAIGRERAFCSHPDVVQTLNSPPTPFCSISGMVLQFTAAMVMGCWVAQLTYMVILLYFPFFGERTLKKKKNIYHAVSLVVIITLSLITPVVALVWFPYVTVRFPPVFCLPSNQDWVFYSMGLPLSIVTAIGVILCLLLIRAIHKGLRSEANELKDRLTSKKKRFFSAPEVKLLILSVSLVVLGVVALGKFSYTLATQGQYSRDFVEYSLCQLQGNNPDCIVETVINDINIATNVMTAMALAALPFMNLIFPAWYSDFVKMANTLCWVCRRKWSCSSRRVEEDSSVKNNATESPRKKT